MPGLFLGVTTAKDFAKALCVPCAAIPLVVPVVDKMCRKDGCPFVAIEGNDLHCCAHQKSWYPLTGQRGCSLLGPEFMRFGRNVGNPCDCSTPQCIEAGYSPNQGAMYISESGRDVVMNTPGLFSKDQLQKLEKRKQKFLRLNPWHFFPEHRILVEGKWKLDYKKSEKRIYKDLEGRQYNFPPPRYTVKSFLRDEYFSSYVRPQDRWRHLGNADGIPQWMKVMIDADLALYHASNSSNVTASSIFSPKPVRAAQAKQPTRTELKTVTKGANMWEARAIQLQKELEQARIEHANQLSGQKRKFDEMMAKSEEEKSALRLRVQELEKRVEVLEGLIKQMESEINELKEQKGQPLRYKDLYPGGVLADHVRSLTLFHTIEQMDAFLNLLNHTDGSQGSRPVGDGYCENLRRYSKVSWDERGNEIEPSLLDDEDYAAYLKRRNAARKDGGMTWKDDFLAWSIYVRAGTTMDFAAAVVGVSIGRLSDIFHEWNNLLDSSLQEAFPDPTRSQMLRAYPRRFIEADGHARCFLLLDATEVFAQKSSNNNVASSTHSDYKMHCTIKP